MKFYVPAAVLTAMFVLGACTPPEEAAGTGTAPAADANAAQRALDALFADEWTTRLERDPLFASQMGIDDYDHRLPDVSEAAMARALDEDREFLERLDAIDRTALAAEDALNYDLFRFVVQSRAGLARYRPHLVPILSDAGFHTAVQRMHDAMPFRTAADYDRYLARLRALGEYFDQNIANMREGLRLGITQPRAILENIRPSIAGSIVAQPEDSVFYTPFLSIPSHVGDDERERLRREGAAAVADVVVPAYERFLAFFTEEYMPGARETLGASAMPGGADWYAELVKYYTTLADATPEGIHELGLAEVARIRNEMDAVIAQAEYGGTFAEFVEFLRTDARFYVDDPEDLLKEASWIAKKIDGQMPAFFRTIPRLPYGVMPVPEDIAPNYTPGRYWGAPVGGRRGGYYLVNTHALDKRPLYELPALTAHEAAPGHHQQNALRRELEDLPEFRRAFYPHAFGEGWGLYAEKLAIDFGIYETPYDHFGRLSYEMWRACRLVIDTGIHAMDWSREEALDYLASNTALSLHNVRTEVDRYISWPGQARAYKMGELKILELRARAERELGRDFDIRDFHDAVLLTGGLTLDLLESEVDRHIQAARTH